MGSETFILGIEGALNIGGRTHWEPSGSVRTANWLPGFAQQVIEDEDVIHTSVYAFNQLACMNNLSNQRLTLR